jgi:hypothetical protein
MELLSIINKNLHNQSIIVVDDHNFGKGKGMYISEFMNKIGVQKVFEEYQVVYKLS